MTLGDLTGLGMAPQPYSKSCIVGVTIEQVPLDMTAFFTYLEKSGMVRYAMNVQGLLHRTVPYSPFEQRKVCFNDVARRLDSNAAIAHIRACSSFTEDDLTIFLRAVFEASGQAEKIFPQAATSYIPLADSGYVFQVTWQSSRNSWYFQLVPDGPSELRPGDRLFSQYSKSKALAA